MSTYTEIPYVPEGVLDPAAGTNAALRILRALTQTCVVSIGETTPPALTGGGDKYIVGAGATALWSGMGDYLAEDMGTHWDFFEPGTLARFVVNLDDATGYFYDPNASSAGWQALT